MTTTRRVAFGFGGNYRFALMHSRPLKNYLWGTWKVRCPNKHDDTVTQATAQHECEKCHQQVFKDGKVTVVCPNGHPNEVPLNGKKESVICQNGGCKLECRRDK